MQLFLSGGICFYIDVLSENSGTPRCVIRNLEFCLFTRCQGVLSKHTIGACSIGSYILNGDVGIADIPDFHIHHCWCAFVYRPAIIV